MAEPLQPLAYGPLIDAAARLVVRHRVTMIGLSTIPFLVFVPLLPLVLLSGGPNPPDPNLLEPWMPLIAVVGLVVLLVLGVAWPVTAAALHYAGAQARLGEAPRAGEALRVGWRLLWPIGWVLTLITLFALGIGLVCLLATWLADEAGHLAAVLIGLAGCVALAVVVLRLTLVLPVVVLEQRRGVAALDRSAALMRGQVLRALAIFLIINLCIAIVSGVLGAGLAPIPAVGGALSMLGQLFVQAVGTAVNAVATLFIYVDVRCRAEGLTAEQLAAQVLRAAAV
ncbi:MAG: glycerophosphoryl diester phosphodiesterase membrane domain-containing protein [Deltaproteobacteria bacterium]|nr:glycerophosphoryl diester phosphodiesterase membrane domain-containing protein [Deltaproteobacteria bacterium]